MSVIETDYLVVGAGAMGMAFADTLVRRTDARILIIDRNHQPGGHWTRAYPFVRLHQPSSYYGVDSRELGSGRTDTDGWNAGLSELAGGAAVCAYFDHVMQHDLLPTGRVRYLPMTEYLGQHRLRDLSGAEHRVEVSRRIVDATYLQTVVPAMRAPGYAVDPAVLCVPPNELPLVAPQYRRFVIIGAGKTGIDSCLWLLRNGIDPDAVQWVMPRDSWYLDRANVQPGPQLQGRFRAALAAKLDASRSATSVADLFDRLEAGGNLLRLDRGVRPTMYRCATVSIAELEQLQRLTDIVRAGRVLGIAPEGMTLTGGTVPAEPATLYVDCSADGLERRPAVPIFGEQVITLQSVRGCQQVFSAALIAYLESVERDDFARNALCIPVPHPDTDLDWLPMTHAEQRNEITWIGDEELLDWAAASRLNLLAGTYAPMLARPRARDRLLGMLTSALAAANANLEVLLGETV